MEKDKFKDFIQEHQEEFDTLEPSADAWKGINSVVQKDRSRFDAKVMLRIAASLFFILGAAWLALEIGTKSSDELVQEEASPTENSYEYAFSGISEELAEVEHFYVSEVAQKESELLNYEVDDELMVEVTLLNEEFEALKIEMGQSADPMKVVEAMINNYQLRLEILQQILHQIEREKNLQNGKDESYV